jgi:hypothetical protein
MHTNLDSNEPDGCPDMAGNFRSIYHVIGLLISSDMPQHVRATYNDIHKLIRAASEKIDSEFKPDLFIAIGEVVEL